MNKSKRLSCAKAFALFAVIPAVVWANRSGPPAGHSGAPGEPTCAACHTGTAVNPPGGSVVLTAAGGTSYVPGTAQRITVRATDTGTRIYGFQASARIASSGTVAGTFTPGAGQQVICGTAGGERDLPRPAAGCPAGTWEYIEHNQPGNGEFQFDWTPPAAASGDILISVAANSANNNNQPTGDRIFTTSLTLTPGASGGNRPAVSQGGVVNGANFSAGIQSGSWVTIFGTNFSSTALTSWNIGQDGRFPTELAGVRVNIAGKPAYIKDVVGGASGQINVQVPDDIGTGNVPVEVITSAGTSTPVTAEARAASPAFFMFPFESNRYLAAVHAIAENGQPVYLLKSGLFPAGVQTRPAKPGDVVLLFGNSFGPTNPAVPAGQVFSGAATLVTPPVIRIGGANAQVQFAGLSAAGLYQFNVVIPDVPNGDQPVVAELPGGLTTQSNAFITIQR